MHFHIIKLPKFISKIIAFFVKLFSKKENSFVLFIFCESSFFTSPPAKFCDMIIGQ